MKKIFYIIMLFASFCIYACDNDSSNKDKGNSSDIPTINIGGNTYNDYSKYKDEKALEDVKFGEVVSAEFVGTPTKYNGYWWEYTNEAGDKIHVEYSLENPKEIENIYYSKFGKNTTTPLMLNGEKYMTVNYWKKLHPLYFDEVPSEDCVLYKRSRDFGVVEKSDIVKFGLTDDQMELILPYYKYIPFKDIRSISEMNTTGYRYTKYYFTLHSTSERIFSTTDNRRYYFQFFEDGTFSFYDNSNRYIIDKNEVNEQYYFYEQIEKSYISDFVEKKIREYLNDEEGFFSSKSFSSDSEQYNKYKINYSFDHVNVEAHIVVDIDTDIVHFEKIIYGSNVIYLNNDFYNNLILSYDLTIDSEYGYSNESINSIVKSIENTLKGKGVNDYNVYVSNNKLFVETVSKNDIDIEVIKQAVDEANRYDITLRDWQNNLMATKKELFESKAASLSDETDSNGNPIILLHVKNTQLLRQITEEISNKEDSHLVIWLGWEEGDEYGNLETDANVAKKIIYNATVSCALDIDTITIAGNYTISTAQMLVHLINSSGNYELDNLVVSYIEKKI